MWAASALLWGLQVGALQWTTPPGCPDEAEVRTRVDELLVTSSQSPRWRARGSVEPDDQGYVLRLDIEVEQSVEQRELHAADCALLTSAGALVIAVTVDARATAATLDAIVSEPEDVAPAVPEPLAPASEVVEPRRPSLTPWSSTTASPSPRTTSRADRSARRTSSTRPPVGFGIGAAGGVSAGLMPDVSGVVEGQLSLHVRELQIMATGYHLFASEAAVEPGAGVRAALSGGSLRGCYAFSQGRVEVPVCAGVDLAALHGGGQGERVVPQDVLDLWMGATASAGMAIRVTRRFALTARVEGIVALRRPAMLLTVEDAPQEVFRVAPFGVRLVAGPTFFLRR